MKFIHC